MCVQTHVHLRLIIYVRVSLLTYKIIRSGVFALSLFFINLLVNTNTAFMFWVKLEKLPFFHLHSLLGS